MSTEEIKKDNFIVSISDKTEIIFHTLEGKMFYFEVKTQSKTPDGTKYSEIVYSEKIDGNPKLAKVLAELTN